MCPRILWLWLSYAVLNTLARDECLRRALVVIGLQLRVRQCMLHGSDRITKCDNLVLDGGDTKIKFLPVLLEIERRQIGARSGRPPDYQIVIARLAPDLLPLPR